MSTLYTKSKPTADKVGTALGKGYKKTTKFLGTPAGKKVMVGTATILAAGFIGAEAGQLVNAVGATDLFGSSGGGDLLRGGGGGGVDASSGGGDFSSSDPQAVQAYNNMAEQGRMNALSLIDDTQYELVPAGSNSLI
jgi:hypothetical protein